MDEKNNSEVDSTLPPEWSLPELPKDITPSLTSAEFDEIFGGSGDEEGNFPLSVGGLKGHMELPDPNELFNTSILGPKPLNVSAEKTEVDSKSNDKPSGKGSVTAKNDNKKATEEPKQSEPLVTSNLKEDNDENIATPSSVDKGQKVTSSLAADEAAPAINRRSARLRAKDENLEVGGMVTIKDEPSEEFDEENLVDSLLERNIEVFEQKESKESGTDGDTPSSPPLNVGGANDTDTYTTEDEDSDDPDKLWCICQQPHNDRFMICCDSCGEWYHGDCVGISVIEGKRMEKTGQEYICTKCVHHENEMKAEREKNRSMRLARREQIREKKIAEIKSGKKSFDSEAKDSTYTPEDMLDKIEPKNRKKRSMIRDLVKKPCLGPGCEKLVIRPCLYCSDECIERHYEFSLKKLSVRGLLPSKEQGITVYEPSTKKMLTGHSAPTQNALLQFLKDHKSFKVFVPSQKVLAAVKKPPVKKFRRESERDEQVPDSSSKPSLDPVAIRGHAKKALRQVLTSRCQASSDIVKTDEEIASLADDIELKLYNLYNQDVTQKYRSKGRSLLFNLKDTKNQVLFMKLMTGELTTRQLVRMTPDQLASEELAEWREKTIKKELEMIKEVAIEEAQLSSSGVIRKMTYKGEVEIERHTETGVMPTDKVDEVTSTTSEQPPAAVSNIPQSSNTSVPSYVRSRSVDTKTSDESPGSSLLTDILTDTTSQHGSHVFDQNCDICLGKKADKNAIAFNKTTASPNSFPSPDSRTTDNELITTEVASPDPISTYSEPSYDSVLSVPMTPVWSGSVSMHGLDTTTMIAYPVSGPYEKLDIQNIFPESLLIVGRIAHVQVWDYIDKLRSSLTKEIVVLRLERREEDSLTYLNLMDYLIHKRRYGVIQCSNISGVKDMYLVPLQYDDPPPSQLFPFDGPGLPVVDRRDIFLCILTRLKTHQPTTDQPRKRKYSNRVHFSSSTPPAADIPRKRSRSQVQVVGFGDTTPPLPPLAISNDPYDPPTLSPSQPIEDIKHKPFFYRETDIEMSVKTTEEPMEHSGDLPPVTSVPQTESGSGIKSILSSLSDEKIKELASVAMSTFGSEKGNITTEMTAASSPVVAPSKTEISTSIESASLMKGSLPKYSISTAKIDSRQQHGATGTSHSPQKQHLSLDERLQATFGQSATERSNYPMESEYGTEGPHDRYQTNSSYPQSHSSYPHSHSYPAPHQEQGYSNPNMYQRRPDQPQHSGGNYNTYYPPHGGPEEGGNRGGRQHNPHSIYGPPPDGQRGGSYQERYSDYEYGGGYEYGYREGDHYRGDNRGYGGRSGPSRSNDEYRDNWGYHDNSYRERDRRGRRSDDYGR